MLASPSPFAWSFSFSYHLDRVRIVYLSGVQLNPGTELQLLSINRNNTFALTACQEAWSYVLCLKIVVDKAAEEEPENFERQIQHLVGLLGTLGRTQSGFSTSSWPLDLHMLWGIVVSEFCLREKLSACNLKAHLTDTLSPCKANGDEYTARLMNAAFHHLLQFQSLSAALFQESWTNNQMPKCMNLKVWHLTKGCYLGLPHESFSTHGSVTMLQMVCYSSKNLKNHLPSLQSLFFN